jgi:lipopolysaccharide transport system ATP-binding protein
VTRALELQGVGKAYVLGTKAHRATTLVDRISQSRQREADAARDVLWALKDVSFHVDVGETVGLIGHNGAGKSTTLKVISRITPPTQGKITVHGTVGSLLEVGTGFHPELTGRENIFFNGALLGLSRRRVTQLFDSIVDFAEIDTFLDTPVKRYSSGMYMRLAFAVAAHLAPDVLIIDEVLAVGDASFQKKCLAKIRSIAAAGDRAVLFVSHNMETVSNLCSRVVVMDHGSTVYDGAVRGGIAHYLALFAQESDNATPGVYTEFPNHEGVERVLSRLRVLDKNGEPTEVIDFLDPMDLEIELDREKDLSNLIVAAGLISESGQLVTYSTSLGCPTDAGRLVCHIPKMTLRPGRYHIGVSVRAVGAASWVEYSERSAHLTVVPVDAALSEDDTWGVVTLEETWELL